HVYAERRCRGLNDRKLADLGDGSIPQHRHPFYARRDLFEQFQPFCAETVFPRRKSSDVAAWAREAVNKAGADRIRHQHENDRHGASYLLQRPSWPVARITSGASATNSAAYCRRRAILPREKM